MRAFLLMGLADPTDDLMVNRAKRFAGMFMGEDPEAPNYDPQHKIIKSIWNGSKGPMLRKATVYDWVGDPVPGTFHLLHNPARDNEMLDLMKWYPRMLAHCDDYLDSVGDTNLNLASTLLGLNAFALTGEQKYKDWTVEYLSAWKARSVETGGWIPSNIGLDGKLGGEHNGQWWKGTYGWNFTIYDGELQEIAHRNYFTAASWTGFANGLLMTGDQSYVDVLRKQMDLIYDAKKVENGKTLLPTMRRSARLPVQRQAGVVSVPAGDLQRPAGRIYLWSMAGPGRIPLEQEPWLGYLEGKNADYPVKALQRDFEYVRERVERMRNDPTSPDTRLADYLLRIVPPATDSLTELMLGGYFARGKVWAMHSRLRYFDPAERRSGIPKDVASLVSKLTDNSVTVTLVNTNQVEAREVQVQAGGYGEHQFKGVKMNGQSQSFDAGWLNVKLDPGAGATLELSMDRYVNPPTLAQPWNRGWIGPQQK